MPAAGDRPFEDKGAFKSQFEWKDAQTVDDVKAGAEKEAEAEEAEEPGAYAAPGALGVASTAEVPGTR